MIYRRDDERKIRVRGLVTDWTASGLLQAEQRDRMLADLHVDYRRTNIYLRGALFVFGIVLLNAAVGLLALMLDLREAFGFLLMSAAIGMFFLAQWLIARYRFYRFGLEEASAVSAIVSFGMGAAIFMRSGFSSLRGFIALAGASFIVFNRYGYLYAGIAAVIFAGIIPFNFGIFTGLVADTPRRLMAIVIFVIIFGLARERRKDHDDEFPGDLYGALETTAWIGIYVLTNLKISEWLSIPDGVPVFYWATYAFTWILPAVGLLLAVIDRHRWLLDASILMAIVTLMTNKPYLGGVQKPWDPIVFGLVMIAIAVALKRWLSSGADGSRSGFIAERLLASERERLAIAGGATALGPGAPRPHTHEPPPPTFGGGHSGGGGAAGKF
ncbi:MAG TPA: hypothetical protein VFZ31_06505 [Vicinamibacterales bacterium]